MESVRSQVYYQYCNLLTSESIAPREREVVNASAGSSMVRRRLNTPGRRTNRRGRILDGVGASAAAPWRNNVNKINKLKKPSKVTNGSCTEHRAAWCNSCFALWFCGLEPSCSTRGCCLAWGENRESFNFFSACTNSAKIDFFWNIFNCAHFAWNSFVLSIKNTHF